MTAVDDVANNSDIVFSPKGTGAVKVTGQFIIDDQTFILEDAQGPKARFEVSNIGTGTNTQYYDITRYYLVVTELPLLVLIHNRR